MPEVFFHGFGRNERKRRRLVRDIADAVARAYDCDPRTVTVNILDVRPDHISHGGTLASEGGTKKPPKDKRFVREY